MLNSPITILIQIASTLMNSNDVLSHGVKPFKSFRTEIASKLVVHFVVVLFSAAVVVGDVVAVSIAAAVAVVWLLFWFVPPSVGGQVSGTIEDFVTLRTSVLHVHDHRASAIERRKVIILLLQKPFSYYVGASYEGDNTLYQFWNFLYFRICSMLQRVQDQKLQKERAISWKRSFPDP